jgi:hypothetical protein
MPDSNGPGKIEQRWTTTLDGSQLSIVKYGIVEFLRRHPYWRIAVGTVGTIAFIGDTAFMLLIHYGLISYVYVCMVAAPLLLWLATVSGPSFTLTFGVAKATEERQAAEKKFEESQSPQDALSLDFTRLNEYYTINQAQARSSFRWAVFAMIIGLATIISGVWLFYFRRSEPDKFMAGLSTAAGVVLNLISGSFLYLSSKTQDRSLLYYSQLARLQRISLAVRLVENHLDPDEQAQARNLVIARLLADQDQLQPDVLLPTPGRGSNN